MGMGGSMAAETVGRLQLFLCFPVSVLGIAVTGHQWKNMEIRDGWKRASRAHPNSASEPGLKDNTAEYAFRRIHFTRQGR